MLTSGAKPEHQLDANLISVLVAPFRTILRHRAILMKTTLVELRTAYAGSALGLFWVVMGPLLMLSMFALTYAVIFRVRPTNMTVSEYVLYVFCGLIPFLAFSNSLSAGTLSISSNRALLLNTVFPAELIPVRSVLVASASLATGTLILLVGDVLLSRPSPTFLLIPVVIVFQLMFTMGLCWMLSLASLLVRDIQQTLYFITMLLLIITPIAYTPDMTPEQLKFLMYLNPLFYFVISFQYLVILDRIPPMHIIVIGAALSVTLFTGGYLVFSRSKQAFYDYA